MLFVGVAKFHNPSARGPRRQGFKVWGQGFQGQPRLVKLLASGNWRCCCWRIKRECPEMCFVAFPASRSKKSFVKYHFHHFLVVITSDRYHLCIHKK